MKIHSKEPTFLSLSVKKFDIEKKKKLIFKDNKLKLYVCNFLNNKYRFFILSKSNKKFFLKTINKNDSKFKEEKKILKYLIKKKNVHISKFNGKIKNNKYLNKFYNKKKKDLICFDLIENIKAIKQKKDFYNLGKSLFFLHEVLKSYPNKKIILKNTYKRVGTFKKNFFKFIKKKYKIQILKKIKIIFENENKIFDELKKIKFSCPNHGDLVPSNIIYSKDKIFFIDFEDTYYSFFFRELDVALLIERFILINNKYSQKNKNILIKEIIKGYREQSDFKIFDFVSLSYCLKFNNIKSILNLLENLNLKKSYIKKELKKFIFLYESIKLNENVIKNF